MLPLYKTHIFYLSEHAVDPDKRRYALKNEAYRHYIDVDHWDTIPFPSVPRDLKTAILDQSALIGFTPDQDTILLNKLVKDLDLFYKDLISDDRYSTRIDFEEELIIPYLADTSIVIEKYQFVNLFVGYGVLPYFLEDYYRVLVKVLSEGNLDNILRISADIGHYIGDAHVPLHTTVNYNGQLTDQLGIHAFWESRLPELYAVDEYDMLVGKAEYIEDKTTFFWDIITESHHLLDEVLEGEKQLKNSYPEDQQYCFEERLERTVRVECSEYSAAYHELLDGMVEQRMQDAILALGCVWYSAWVDAGQPDLAALEDNRDLEEQRKAEEELNRARNENNIFGRSHN